MDTPGAPDPNIIGPLTIYRIEVLDDGPLKCKCRNAPHGNEDDDKAHRNSDSASCTWPWPSKFFFMYV